MGPTRGLLVTPVGVVRVESEPPGANPTYQVGVYWRGGGWLSAPRLVSVRPVSLPLQVVGLGLRILDVLLDLLFECSCLSVFGGQE